MHQRPPILQGFSLAGFGIGLLLGVLQLANVKLPGWVLVGGGILAVACILVGLRDEWRPSKKDTPANLYEALLPIHYRFNDLIYERGRGTSGAIDDFDWAAWGVRVRDAQSEAFMVLHSYGPEYVNQLASVDWDAELVDLVDALSQGIDEIMKAARRP